MIPDLMNFLDIQSWWEIPCIAHFCSLFSSAFKLPEFDIEDLEEALLTDGTDGIPGLLPELIVSLLKGCDTSNKDITTSNYQMFLRRIFRRKCEEYNIENTFNSDIDFQSLPLRTKIINLHLLCDIRLDSADVQQIFNRLESESLRVEPLGYDSNGSTYWYFYGTRLYREDRCTNLQQQKRNQTATTIGQSDTVWQVICFTEEDWNNLVLKLEKTRNKKERALLNILKENFLPQIPQLFKKKELLRRRKLLKNRNSSRLRSIAIAKETELLQLKASIGHDKLTKTSDTSDNEIKFNRRQNIKDDFHLLNDDTTDIETDNSEKYHNRHHLRTNTRAREIIVSSPFPADNADTIKDIENFPIKRRRRSHSSSAHSVISTYAGSTPSCDILYQQHTINHHNFIVVNRSDDDDDSFSEDNKEVHNSNRCNKSCSSSSSSSSSSTSSSSSSSGSSCCSSNCSGSNSSYNNFSDKNNICKNNKNKIDNKNVNDNNINRLSQQIYNSSREDKENINTITLSTDDSDSDSGNSNSGVIIGGGISIVGGTDDSGVDEDEIKIDNKMPPTNNTNAKLPGRQTNNSLSSLTGNIFIPPFNNSGTTAANSSGGGSGNVGGTAASGGGGSSSTKDEPKSQQSNAPIRKKKVKSSEIFTPSLIPTLSFTETEEVLQIGMHKVLEYVKNHKDAWPFMDPVEEDIAPRYYSIIRRPMDLLKMEEKLDNGEYLTFIDFRNDFKLIVNNCRLYNGQNNEYTEMVNNLQLAFEKATKKYFEQNSSDEEINLEYPDLKTNVFREKNLNPKSYTPKQLLLKEFANKTKESTTGASATGGNDKRQKDSQKSSNIAASATVVKHKDSIVDEPQKSGTDKVATPRGTKRKRKDKDKRRKKKTKSTKGAKRVDESSNDDDDDVLNDDKNDINSCDDDDIVAVAKAATSDSDSENEINVKATKRRGGGSKPEKKKRKLSAVSATVPIKNTTPTKRDKSATKKDDVVAKSTATPSSSVSKRKSKKTKKEELFSEPDELDEVNSENDDDDDDGDDASVSPKVQKKVSKSKKCANKLVTKNNAETKLKSEKQSTKSTAGRNRNATTTSPSTTKKDNKVDKKNLLNSDKSNRKSAKAKKSSKLTSKKEDNDDDALLKNIDDDDDDDDEDMRSISSDGGVIDYPVQTTKLKKGKATATTKSKKDDAKVTSSSLSQKKVVEKENQNFKSKRKSTKKQSTTPANSKKSDDKQIEQIRAASSLGSRSRSSSRSISPVFTVDLHKKYSQSASSDKFQSTGSNLQSLPTTINSQPQQKQQRKRHGRTKKAVDDDDDMRSISSRSFSRSPSPLASHYSSTHSLASIDAAIRENVRSPTPPKIVRKKTMPIVPSRPITPDIKDKFDLIKERRSKLNQMAKEQEKLKEAKSAVTSASTSTTGVAAAAATVPPPIKNQTLKETIEKLKATNKTSKERASLLDEIFGAKPAKEVRDERTIFERLRETIDPTATTSTPTTKSSTKPVNKADEYNFVDDLVATPPTAKPTSGTKAQKTPKEPKAPKPRKQSAKAIAAAAAAAANASAAAANKSAANKSTNMEALELETEQTLKDINKWLENTPRFSDFNSASNSPSRYNLLDDLDAKLDAADFRRPVTIPVPVVHKQPTVTPPLNGSTVSHTAATATSTNAAQPSAISAASGSATAMAISSGGSDLSATRGVDTLIAATPLPVNIPTTAAAAPISTVTQSSTTQISTTTITTPPTTTTSTTTTTTQLTTHTTGKQTIQLTGIPPAPGPHKRDPKEPKRKSLKEKLLPKRKDIHQTIARLQPGKTKGNLLHSKSGSGSAGASSAADEHHHHHHHHASGSNLTIGGSGIAANHKPKEIKNSLVQPTNESGPKLSLGSVLNTDGFGLGQQHNFGDDIVKGDVNISDEISKDRDSDDMELEEIITSTETRQELEKVTAEKDKHDLLKMDEPISDTSANNNTSGSSMSKGDCPTSGGASGGGGSGGIGSGEKPSATPNLSAWFKAFGAPKKSKKAEEEEAAAAAASAAALEAKKAEDEAAAAQKEAENLSSVADDVKSSELDALPTLPSSTASETNAAASVSTVDNPLNSILPVPRTRKASTGSSVSERSSFSQDPDSPRIGIDERLGAYPAPYPSPLGASPIMASPKDELPKPASPYPINGAIKVGFYQDTTTKSSPEKSCSPREQPSPYSNYAQHLYSSASATVAAAYGGACSYNAPTDQLQQQHQQQQQTATLGFNNKNKTHSYYDQYKQPRSQDSDYNSSMSPNPNSPYQNQQQSPYQQPDASPYQQPQSSPYQSQSQLSPFQPQQQTTPNSPNAPHYPSPNSPNTPQYPQPHSPYQQQQQQQQQSYQQPNSPLGQFPQSVQHQQTQPQAAGGFPTQQQQQHSPLQSFSPQHQMQPSTISKPSQQTNSQQANSQQLQISSPHQQAHSPFQSNPSSPYSQHDANSPYSQQGPISPFGSVAQQNPNSPTPQQQQSQQVKSSVQQQQQQQPSTQQQMSNQDWVNPLTQQQATQPIIPQMSHSAQQQQQQPPQAQQQVAQPQVSQSQVPQHHPQPVSQQGPQQHPQQVPQQHSQQVPQQHTQQHPQPVPQQVPQQHPQQIQQLHQQQQQQISPHHTPESSMVPNLTTLETKTNSVPKQSNPTLPLSHPFNAMPAHMSNTLPVSTNNKSQQPPTAHHGGYMQPYPNPYNTQTNLMDRRTTDSDGKSNLYNLNSNGSNAATNLGLDILATERQIASMKQSTSSAVQQQQQQQQQPPQSHHHHHQQHQEQQHMNLGFSEQSLIGPPKPIAPNVPKTTHNPHEKPLDTSNSADCRSLETPKPPSLGNNSGTNEQACNKNFESQSQKMFDHLFTSMNFGKGLGGFGKNLDISTSKAFEMFNRAASMGFPKGFHGTPTAPVPPPSSSSTSSKIDDKSTSSSSSVSAGIDNAAGNFQRPTAHGNMHQTLTGKSTDMVNMGYQPSPVKSMDSASSTSTSKPLNMAHSGGYNHQHSSSSSAAASKSSSVTYPQTSMPMQTELQHNKSSLQQQMSQSSNSYPTNLSAAHQNKMSNVDMNHQAMSGQNSQHLQQQQQQQQQKSCELNVPNLQQRYDMSRQSHPSNIDLSNFKSSMPFNASTNAAGMIDPSLRNHGGPLSIMDESLLGLQSAAVAAAANSYYQQKEIPPAHMFSKSIQQATSNANLQQMLNNTMSMAYNANRDAAAAAAAATASQSQTAANNYQRMHQQQTHQQHHHQQHQQQQQPHSHVPSHGGGAASSGAQQDLATAGMQPLSGIDPKVTKRTRKKKTPTPNPMDVMQSQMLQHQQQGFQSYAGLKTNSPSLKSSPNDQSAIALKTAAAAASMVPGSAFNFGPTPPGLNLGTGIYGDNTTGYLDDFRGTPNPYYLPTGHRNTPPDNGSNTDKSSSSAAATSSSSSSVASTTAAAAAAASTYQFLSHPSSRTSAYPFMNAQLDPNSQIYQQYLQQRHDEMRARMMLNQGLLGHGASAGYPQTGYHPALTMHKSSYDAMNSLNRPPWFQ